MSRIELPDMQMMSSEQRAACEEAVAGPRGKVPAPMIAWLRNPELARRAQHLGALLRFQTSLTPRQSELSILVCARHWTSHHEWTAHKKIALDTGLAPDIITAIARGRTPVFHDSVEQVVYELSHELLRSNRLSDDSYDEGVCTLGEQGLVELVAILGYYSMVALTLNAFKLGLPESFSADLDDMCCSSQRFDESLA